MRAAAALAVLGLGAGLTACGSGGQGSGQPGRTHATTQAAVPECRKLRTPAPKRHLKLARPHLALDSQRTYQAVVDTSCGSFTITLDVKDSPKTTASFVYLARRGFYDRLMFHRVVSGFVIQGGDPLGNGTGDPGYHVVEPPPRSTHYTRGVVAMAKAETDRPGTSGSQFYVVTGEDAQLPPDYALLGRVTTGQTVVDAIGVVPTDQGSSDPAKQDRPRSPVVIEKITIQEQR
ncbi:MAG: peptidylprolyl isomerase [Solirubrobacteraceae bacterium]